MKIHSFQFEDKERNFCISSFELKELTLLVGASGVGKTQTLLGLHALRKIATGENLNGVEWSIRFEADNKKVYTWEGAFEKLDIFEKNDEEQAIIESEKLFLGEEELIKRDKADILFKGAKTVKLSRHESVISLLKEEDEVSIVNYSLKKLHFVDYTNISKRFSLPLPSVWSEIAKIPEKYGSLQKIQESNLKPVLKLFALQQADSNVFDTIIARFISIFPMVQEVKVCPLDREISEPFNKIPFLHLKEHNADNWVSQMQFSSGMYRTLIQLIELYLSPDGTVFLIDEFENSLGVNCINEVMNDMLSSERDLQFILTSHHPYIIDAIPFSHWKIVTRKGGMVKVHDAEEFQLGRSKHSAFMQLLQLDEYQTGEEQG